MEEFERIMGELSVKGEQCLKDIDEWYKEFQDWKECLKDDLERLKNNKGSRSKLVPVIPTTPAASIKKRTRRKLSAVPELSEETATTSGEGRSRRKAVKNEETKLKDQNVPVRRSKRARFTHESVEEPDIQLDILKTGNEALSANGDAETTNNKENSNSNVIAGAARESKQNSRISKKSKSVKSKGKVSGSISSLNNEPKESSSGIISLNNETAEHLSNKFEMEEQSNKQESFDKETVENVSVEMSTDKVENSADEILPDKEVKGNSSAKEQPEILSEEKQESPVLEKKSLRIRSLRVLCNRLSSQKVVAQTSTHNQRLTRQTSKKSLQMPVNKKTLKKNSTRQPSIRQSSTRQKHETLAMETDDDEETEGTEEKDDGSLTETNCSDEEYRSCTNITDMPENENKSVCSSDPSDTNEGEQEVTTTQGKINQDATFTKTNNLPKTAKSPVLFSPYANETVKKRVAAYETLNSVPEETEKVEASPVRITRTKARALAAKAAAPKNEGNDAREAKSNQVQRIARASLNRALKRLAVKKDLNHDTSKENTVPVISKAPGKLLKGTPLPPSKVLTDNNCLSVPQNTLRRTPLIGPGLLLPIPSSTGQLNKSNSKVGIVLTSTQTFIKKKVKPVQDIAALKLEEQRRREEKEQEVQRRKLEMLKKRAQQQKKQDEKRIKVLQNREAQDKEKQDIQLRLGKEKEEKFNNFLQQREAQLKEEALRKKCEADRKAAEARKKLEEAEAARVAKLKVEEQQRKKEQEESELQRQGVKRVAEEKETTAKRCLEEKLDKDDAPSVVQNIEPPQPPVKDNLNATFTKPTTTNYNNVYNLNDIDTDEDSGDESSRTRTTAPWAKKHHLLHKSQIERRLHDLAEQYFACPRSPMDLQKIFQTHVQRQYKRTSSAIWNTPPRYSQLPKY